MDKVLELLKDYEARKVFGELTIKFEAGKVSFIEKMEKIKLGPELNCRPGTEIRFMDKRAGY
jgi:hypothetical protein